MPKKRDSKRDSKQRPPKQIYTLASIATSRKIARAKREYTEKHKIPPNLDELAKYITQKEDSDAAQEYMAQHGSYPAYHELEWFMSKNNIEKLTLKEIAGAAKHMGILQTTKQQHLQPWETPPLTKQQYFQPWEPSLKKRESDKRWASPKQKCYTPKITDLYGQYSLFRGKQQLFDLSKINEPPQKEKTATLTPKHPRHPKSSANPFFY